MSERKKSGFAALLALVILVALSVATCNYDGGREAQAQTTVTKARLPIEGVSWGYGTVSVSTSTGGTNTRHKFSPINVLARGVVGGGSDGAPDDADSLQAVINEVIAYGTGEIYVPDGDYYITKTITITNASEVDVITLDLSGSTIHVAAALNGPAIQIGGATANVSNVIVRGGIIKPYNANVDWDQGSCGIKIINAQRCEIDGTTIRGFRKGVHMVGINAKGSVFNKVAVRGIRDCLWPFYLICWDDGWVNENIFVGGEIKYTSVLATTDCDSGASIYANPGAAATQAIDNNKFIGLGMEWQNTVAGGSQDGYIPRAIDANTTNSAFLFNRYEGFSGDEDTLACFKISASGAGNVLDGGNPRSTYINGAHPNGHFTTLNGMVRLTDRLGTQLMGKGLASSTSYGRPVLELYGIGGYTANNDLLVIRSQDYGDTLLAVHAYPQTGYGTILKMWGVNVMDGTATPEGAASAPIGSVFMRRNGAVGREAYFKSSGTGNTGWLRRDQLRNAYVDTLTEYTSAAGVLADAVLLKDSIIRSTSARLDTVSMKTALHGVVIDPILPIASAAKTADYQLLASDNVIYFSGFSADSVFCTLPTYASVPVGKTYMVINCDATAIDSVYVEASGAEFLNGLATRHVIGLRGYDAAVGYAHAKIMYVSATVGWARVD